MTGRRQPRREYGPTWFRLENYAPAEGMDAADWLLNLRVRSWLHESGDELGESLIRRCPVLRRGDVNTRLPLLMLIQNYQRRPGEHDPLAYVHDVLADPPKLQCGVYPLHVYELYGHERRLPEPVREWGRTHTYSRVLDAPAAFWERFDLACTEPDLGRFVVVDLSYPNHVLLARMEEFLKEERRLLAPHGGPYREAVRINEKRRASRRPERLATLASCQLLPYLDLDRWRTREGVRLSDYAMCTHLLHIDPKSLKKTKEHAAHALFGHVLKGWLEPLAHGLPTRSERRR